MPYEMYRNKRFTKYYNAHTMEEMNERTNVRTNVREEIKKHYVYIGEKAGENNRAQVIENTTAKR